MKILVTGIAGFIGFHVSKALLDKGYQVIGLDNINDYYEVDLKYSRLEQLGINRASAKKFGKIVSSEIYKNKLKFVRLNLEDREKLPWLFKEENIDVVCNLAAQAGVRYSIENPESYIDSNLVGFLNILECCRHNNIKHLVYASSSSVYGSNKKVPFEVSDQVDKPISLYAATKKSNELMAHTYSHLYNFSTTGLRFFTVYGPWGRPDMAMFLFTKAIIEGKPIKVFNYGELWRDFTYIDDICKGVVHVIEDNVENRTIDQTLYKLYNIGNNKTVKLTEFIEELENALGVAAKREEMPMQDGDVSKTWANVDNLIDDYNYKPKVSVEEGIKNFVEWYKTYYKV